VRPVIRVDPSGFGWPLPAQLGDLGGIVETKGVSWGDVVAALVVVAATAVIAFLMGRLARRVLGRPGTQSGAAVAVAARLVRWAVVLVGAAWSLSLVGVSLGWFTLAVILLLLVIGLIVRPQIESLAASVVLTSRPAYGIGDEIEVLGHLGELVEVTNRSTVLRLRDGRRVHVPNTTMLAETVVVSSTERSRRTTLELTVDERADVARVEHVVLDALVAVDQVLVEPPPVVLARAIRGGAAHLEVMFWHGSRVDEENHARDRAVRALLAALAAAGIPSAMDQIMLLNSRGDGPERAGRPSQNPPGAQVDVPGSPG
jgi:small-conductance mechanosensitive channel